MSASLYSRAMLWIGASLTLVTLLSTIISVQEKRAALISDLRARLVEASHRQAIAVSDAVWKLNKESAEVVLQAVSRDPDFRAARVLDETGRIFASVGTADIAGALTEASEAPILLQGDGRRIGTLALYFSRDRVETMRRESFWEASKLGILQLAAVLLATALALRAVTRPLGAITDRMLTVAAGDLSVPIPHTDRRDQVGKIARAVGVFRQEMKARRLATQELELAHGDLERRIEERTRDLRDSEKRFRDLFHHSPLPMWVFSETTLGFLEVNDAAIARYGYSRDELLSMTLKDIRPPEDLEALDSWLNRAPSDRTNAPEWRHKYKDGRVVDVEVYGHPIEFGGQPARLVVVIDITARKTAERQFQRMFETSQDVILVTDGYGKLLQASPSATATLGYQPTEMVDRLGSDFIYPPDLDATRTEMAAARQGRAVRNFRCRYVHRDGRVVPLVWMAAWSEQDRCHFFFGRDMTDHERTEQQLRQAQKMEAVGQLTGGVAHDFNNILMIIMANAEAIDEEELLDPEIRGRLERISTAIGRAAALTRQLLAFSRKQTLRPQRTAVNDLVVGTTKLLRRTLSERIELSTVLGENLWAIDVDQAQLESAIVNLSINARDAMPEGGRLLIETRNVTLDEDYIAHNPDTAAGEYVMLAVTDTGTGMPPDVLAKVFEPFFTTKEAGKGTGLGLSMVHGFIKQSNGHIKIYSEVGFGTSIRLYLPRAAGEFEAASASQVALVQGGGERVLVVENDPDVQAGVIDQLRSLGYVTAAAPDATAGLEALAAASPPYDLVLTDVIMPGPLDGKALADEVTRRWPQTGIVFMSGYTGSALSNHGQLDVGPILLDKPFRKVELAQALRRALER